MDRRPIATLHTRAPPLPRRPVALFCQIRRLRRPFGQSPRERTPQKKPVFAGGSGVSTPGPPGGHGLLGRADMLAGPEARGSGYAPLGALVVEHDALPKV